MCLRSWVGKENKERSITLAAHQNFPEDNDAHLHSPFGPPPRPLHVLLSLLPGPGSSDHTPRRHYFFLPYCCVYAMFPCSLLSITPLPPPPLVPARPRIDVGRVSSRLVLAHMRSSVGSKCKSARLSYLLIIVTLTLSTTFRAKANQPSQVAKKQDGMTPNFALCVSPIWLMPPSFHPPKRASAVSLQSQSHTHRFYHFT